MKGVEILIQAATSTLALLLATTLFFIAKLFKGSQLYNGLKIILIGVLLIILRSSYLIIISLLNLGLSTSYFDLAIVIFSLYGALYIKRVLEFMIIPIKDKKLMKYLNLDEFIMKKVKDNGSLFTNREGS